MSVNPILLQKILRENASDLQDFSKDLKNWGEEMKRKDDSLKTDTGQSTGKVRKISKAGSTKVKVIGKPKKLTKSGTTNYAAWDKFDVDAELQKLEEDINEDSELTDECNENIYDEALIEKEKGNKFVKNQKWDEAIKSYTKAIECYSYDPVFYANRALCYLKISKFEETEKDCTLSLKLDPTYVKAYQRRAAARSNLNKLENAEMDLLKVLELEPKNKESIIELEKIRQKLNRHTEKVIYSRVTRDIKPIDDSKPSTSWSPQEDIILVKPIQKPPHLRSQKPLKRISITETKGGFTEKTIESPRSQEAVKRHVVERHENIENLNELDEQIGEFKKKKAEKHLEKSEQSKSTVDFKQETQTCFKNEDFKITERTYSASNTKDVKNTVNDNKKLIECNDRDVNLATPKNSVQFYSSWRNLKTPEEKYIYLKSVKPQELPKIFLNSLESDIFSNILEVMVNYYIINKDPVFDILNYFSEVKRFSAITMFMASEDRNNLWKLFDYMKQNSERENDEIDKLRKKYEL
nr:RNA polymerase II-associated protein 3 [Leptinotarsa decemlineata]